MSTPKRYGPAFVADTATNILTPGAGFVNRIKHIHLVNQGASTRTVTLYVGATGGSTDGTELLKDHSMAVAAYTDLYMDTILEEADFLTGIASAASEVVITIDYDVDVTY